ncbi:MAG: PQQ-binding-like beta-propeller repeat protein [Proteobacteria bacterium]|nr:PQQ-binding-like beta-propeller repeat protein [Pseudomonadota bacterium]
MPSVRWKSIAWAIAIIGVPAIGLGAPAAPAVPSDEPILGKWFGQAGSARDRVDLGFEFARDDQGGISAALYGDIFNFYGLLVPGGLVRQGDGSYLNKEWGIRLSLNGDEADGLMLGKAPITLHRVRSLPSEPPMPSFSAGPGPKWQTKLATAIYARAALRDGVAYVGTSGGEFHAIDMNDGSFKWTYSAGRGIFGEALATADAVYFACDNGFLFKLDRATGKELWRYDLGDERVSRVQPHQLVRNSGVFDWDFHAPKPLLADGIVYIGSGDGGMNAIDPANGHRLWRFQAQGKIREGAMIDGPRLIFGTMDNFVYALDRNSGAQSWRISMPGPMGAPASMIGGTLVLGISAGLIAGLDPATGKTNWMMQPWLTAVESSAALDAGTRFFIGSSDMRRVSYMDAKDGSVIWRTNVYGAPWATPEVSGQRVYVSAAGVTPYFAGVDPVVPYPMHHYGSLSALDRKSGQIIWRWQMPEWPGAFLDGFIAAPAVSGEKLLIGGLDGTLYAFPAD